MTKADPEFTCLCIYQWSGGRGQNILDKAMFTEAKWEKHLAVASWLVRSSPDRAVRVRALAGDIVLCSLARHFTLTVPSPPRCINGYRRI